MTDGVLQWHRGRNASRACTGKPVGGRWHDKKARERIRQLRNISRRYDLSSSDRATLEEIVEDMQDALRTPWIGDP